MNHKKLPVIIGSSWDSPLHGGVLRSLQLKSWFKEAGYELVPIDWAHGPRQPTDFFRSIGALCRHDDLWRLGRIMPRHMLQVGYLQRQLRALRKYTDAIIIEYTAPYMIAEARAAGFRVLAFPQNLESLNNRDCRAFHYRGGITGAMHELDFLGSRCAGIWTISSEEAWLFSQAASNVHWLPYIPPEPIIRRCAGIREKRKCCRRDHVLIVNTRQPTADESIRKLLETLEEKAITAVVCGRNTEVYSTWKNWKHIFVAGTVSNEALCDLFVHARCAVVYGRKGGGALTRIPELLLAGVPVVCNVVAARSAWLWQGVVLADSLNDVPQACLQADGLETSAAPPASLMSLLSQRQQELRSIIEG